jgi:hypothetical protein
MIFHLYSKFKILIKFKLTTEGVGVGLLYPKTNATLLGKERYDDFHVSGYGTSLKAGLNLTFFKHFYIQGELTDISICKIFALPKVSKTVLHKISSFPENYRFWG